MEPSSPQATPESSTSSATTEAPAAAIVPLPEGFTLTREVVFDALRPVIDPEIRLSIVDLGLVYDAHISADGKSVEIKMTLTTPMCPYGPMIMTQVQDVANTLPGVLNAKIVLVWEPPWDPKTMASDFAKDKMNIW